MENIHVLFAHKETHILRIEELTPELHDPRRAGGLGDQPVEIFDHRTASVREVRLDELKMNSTPFMNRGWPVAELHWSIAKPAKQHLAIPFNDRFKQYAPMEPGEFQANLLEGKPPLVFTHRSDYDPIRHIQEKVFFEIVVKSRELSLTRLPAAEVGVLSRSLPHFSSLEVLDLDQSQLAGEDAQAAHNGDSRGAGHKSELSP